MTAGEAGELALAAIDPIPVIAVAATVGIGLGVYTLAKQVQQTHYVAPNVVSDKYHFDGMSSSTKDYSPSFGSITIPNVSSVTPQFTQDVKSLQNAANTLGRFNIDIAGIKAANSQISEGSKTSAAGLATMNHAVSGMNQGITMANAGLNTMNHALSGINQTVSGMNQGITMANAGLNTMNHALSGINQTVSGMIQDTAGINSTLQGLNGAITNLNNIVAKLGQHTAPDAETLREQSSMKYLLDTAKQVPGDILKRTTQAATTVAPLLTYIQSVDPKDFAKIAANFAPLATVAQNLQNLDASWNHYNGSTANSKTASSAASSNKSTSNVKPVTKPVVKPTTKPAATPTVTSKATTVTPTRPVINTAVVDKVKKTVTIPVLSKYDGSITSQVSELLSVTNGSVYGKALSATTAVKKDKTSNVVRNTGAGASTGIFKVSFPVFNAYGTATTKYNSLNGGFADVYINVNTGQISGNLNDVIQHVPSKFPVLDPINPGNGVIVRGRATPDAKVIIQVGSKPKQQTTADKNGVFTFPGLSISLKDTVSVWGTQPASRDILYTTSNANGNFDKSSKAYGDEYVREAPDLSVDELHANLPTGWKAENNNGFVHIKDPQTITNVADRLSKLDKNSKEYKDLSASNTQGYRVRIDPADAVTNFTHIHVYNDQGQLLNRDGQIVNYNDPAGHIRYDKPVPSNNFE